MHRLTAALLFLCTTLVAGCAGQDASPDRRFVDERPMAPIDSLFVEYSDLSSMPLDTTGAAVWVDSLMEAMTIDDKIGQLFIVHMIERESMEAARNAVRNHRVGGFLVPRLLDPDDVFQRVRRLQSSSRIPLFVAADYERGVGRFNNALTELPSNMAVGATRDTLFAAAAGRLTAIEARALGVNLLLAPVVDVNNNPDNPIINIRSYGEDPELVGRMAAAFVRAAESRGLMTTLKHFPGHGDTSVDSHARMGTVSGDRADLERVELKPYRIVLEGAAQPTAVMSAHLWIEALDPDPLPATFSGDVLSGLLRSELGFKGVILTDDVRMGALQQRYDVAERIVRPLNAGANVVLTPADLPQAIRFVREALRSGALTEERVDDSVRRILSAKASAGLHRNAVDDAYLDELLKRPRGRRVARAIADRSITLLKASSGLPLREGDRVSVVHLTNYEGSESIAAAMDLVDESLDVERSVRFEKDPTSSAVGRALNQAQDADVVIVALYLRLIAGRGNAGLLPGQSALVERLIEGDRSVVLVTFGNPYAASTFRNADAVVVAYDQSLETARAVVGVMKGDQPAPGRLPITVEPFGFGEGMDRVATE